MTSALRPNRPTSPPRFSVLVALAALASLAGCAGPRATSGADVAPAATPAPATAGPGDTLLATFDGGAITPTEFSAAYRNLLPNERPAGDRLAARRTFLIRMVDRALLAREATKTPLVLTDSEQAELERARTQMIQNDLFDELTKDLPPPTPDELDTFKRQRTHLAEVRFITFKEWQAARSWRLRLSTGTPMAALDEAIARGGRAAPTADAFRPLAGDQIPDTLASVIWAMRPGQVSEVHSFAGQPVLIHLRGFLPRPGAKTGDDLSLREDFRRRQHDRVRNRMRVELAESIGRTFVDPNLDFLLAGFMKIPPRSDVDSLTGTPVMRANLPLPVFTAADTGRILARTKRGELSLVAYLRYWGRVPPYARPEIRERPVLEATIDRVLLESELVDIGRTRGLDQSPKILRELERMKEGFALDHYYAQIIDAKVPLDEARLAAYFASRPGHYDDPAALESRIILVERKELADSLMALLRSGASFADLARTHSNEGQSAAQGGKTGFVLRGGNKNVGLEDAMFATPVGQLGGPERTPEGFVIWKVEGYRPGKKRTLDEAREWVVRDYRTIEGEKILAAHLEELRRKANTRLYPERVTLELGSGSDWGD